MPYYSTEYLPVFDESIPIILITATLCIMPHYFYLARCADDSLYAGTCVDLAARAAKHNDGKGGKYTRSRLPLAIIYHEAFETLGEARRREAEVKAWTKTKKERFVHCKQR